MRFRPQNFARNNDKESHFLLRFLSCCTSPELPRACMEMTCLYLKTKRDGERKSSDDKILPLAPTMPEATSGLFS